MLIIKRDGSKVEYDINKIRHAIEGAFKDCDKEFDNDAILDTIELDLFNLFVLEDKEISVEDIQDVVEDVLLDFGYRQEAKEYIKYRHEHAMARQKHNDEEVLQMIGGDDSYWKTENSNKDSSLVTVQRDYLAGILSTDIARNYIFPKDVIKAHDDGIVHQHDMDYMAQSTLSNCFSADTEFITSEGVKTFNDFYDGSPVIVRDKDGKWRSAIVHNFGKQILYTITLQSGRSVKEIRCTRNHRWILKDGSITENLQIGDSLIALPDVSSDFEIRTVEEAKAFCLGFVIGDGSNVGNNRGVRVRLCGHKKDDYYSYFEQAGYQISKINGTDDVIATNKDSVGKQEFLNSKMWRVMSTNQKIALFRGYYSADGCVDRNAIHTCDERNLSLILEIAPLAGYYIANVRHDIHDIPYKENASLYMITFRKKNNPNNLWKVKDIKKSCNNNHTTNVWCVVEPETHTFTLANGIITGNCELINLNDMLQNGTVINKVKINKPHKLITAMTITTQIMASVAANTYGGESINLAHLAPFVRDSYNLYLKKYELMNNGSFDAEELAKRDLAKEIEDAVQTFNYQISTLFTLNGQAPFCSLFFYINDAGEYKEELVLLIKEFLKQRIKGMPNQDGVFVTQAFPKILYVLQEDNYKPGTKYWDVTQLAIRCSANRLTPDYISEKKMKELKNGDCYACMGCRSFLTPDISGNGFNNISKALDYNPQKPKYWGRFNCGVVSINLPDVAFSSCGNKEKFWKILDERLEIAHKGLQIRVNRLAKTKASVAPILWQHGAMARLDGDETLDKLVHNNYSTASLGYVGGFEMVKIMTGQSQTSPEGKRFLEQVLQHLNDKCAEWREEENIGYSVYGSPAESLAYKFAKKTKARFPEEFEELFGNKKYFENSYHIPSFEEIDPFTKIILEGEFQQLSPGGCLSYIESVDLTSNVEALYPVVECIYNNCLYCEINTKTSYCHVCGQRQTINIHKDSNGDTWWECDSCGNIDTNKMDVAARTCGYVGTNFWNEGKTQEIASRYVHLDDKDFDNALC